MGGGGGGGGFQQPQIIYMQPEPAPKQDDPAVKEAERKQRVIEAGIGGRGATLIAGGAQTDPSRRVGASLFGNFEKMG
jgi:hypothetical protein